MTLNINPTKKSKISSEVRQQIALKSIRREQPVSKIATDAGCCRNTVYKQQSIALDAVDQAFQSASDDNVLFYIPVTRETICTMVIMLCLTCRASIRNIIAFLRDFLGFDISVGSVANIINAAAEKADTVNQSYDLSPIKTASSDEVFHRNKPILASVDIPSRFCAQAELSDARDGNAWGVSLLFLEEQGYKPDSVIVDSAKGMTKGYQITLPDTKIRYDHFHTIRDLKDTARFLQNKAQSTLTVASKSYDKMLKAKDNDTRDKLQIKFDQDFLWFSQMAEISKQFTTLSAWLQYDVLQLAGYAPEQRAELFDFILLELDKLAKIYPHRIKKIRNSLKFMRNKLLDVANTLHDKFRELSIKYNVKLSDIWSICYLARYDYEGLKYQQISSNIEDNIGYGLYERIEDDVLVILETTHRCSSIVENFNSRLTTFVSENKMLTQKMLNLYRFFLNHSPFMRSQHKHLKDKSPAEALTGTKHDLWYKMLGFKAPQLIAA